MQLVSSSARPPAASSLPDLPAAKPIKQAIEKWEEATAREKACRAASLKAEHEVGLAAKRDVAQLADQYEKGPKAKQSEPTGEVEARENLRKAQRQHAASQILAERARATVQEVVGEHGPALAQQLRERLAKLAEVSAELVDGWSRNHAEMTAIARLIRMEDPDSERPIEMRRTTLFWPFVTEFRVRPYGGGPAVVVAVGDVVEKLRELGVAPDPKAPAVGSLQYEKDRIPESSAPARADNLVKAA